MAATTLWLAWLSCLRVLHRGAAAAAPLGAGLRAAVRWTAEHTGLPAAVVAALMVVASWRLVRHAPRSIVEIAVVAALIVGAARLGLLRW